MVQILLNILCVRLVTVEWTRDENAENHFLSNRREEGREFREIGRFGFNKSEITSFSFFYFYFRNVQLAEKLQKDQEKLSEDLLAMLCF